MDTLRIIKIGGQVIDDDDQLHNFLQAFSAVSGPKILVHGGGKKASELSKKLGIKPKLIEGRRITDADTLQVVQMVFAGLINKNITAILQAFNCPAIGLSGADADSIRAVKRPVRDIDYGFAGDITEVNTKFIDMLLKKRFVPVFCALTHDGNGQILNTNADTITAQLGIAMSERYKTDLVYCFEKNGVLADLHDNSSLISHITAESYKNLKTRNILGDGILPKIDNAFDALNNGVKSVFIIHSSALPDLYYTDINSGTRISLK